MARLGRLRRLVGAMVKDPRQQRVKYFPFNSMLLALLAGLLVGNPAPRDVERLSARLGLGRRGKKIGDTALTYLLTLRADKALLPLQGLGSSGQGGRGPRHATLSSSMLILGASPKRRPGWDFPPRRRKTASDAAALQSTSLARGQQQNGSISAQEPAPVPLEISVAWVHDERPAQDRPRRWPNRCTTRAENPLATKYFSP